MFTSQPSHRIDNDTGEETFSYDRNLDQERNQGYLAVVGGIAFAFFMLFTLGISRSNGVGLEFTLVVFGIILAIWGITRIMFAPAAITIKLNKRNLTILKQQLDKNPVIEKYNWNQINDLEIGFQERNYRTRYRYWARYQITFDYTNGPNSNKVQIPLYLCSSELKIQRLIANTVYERWIIEKKPKDIEKLEKRASPKGLYCQIDQEQHNLTDSRYQCQSCGRSVCIGCYSLMKSVGKSNCPHCTGKFVLMVSS